MKILFILILAVAGFQAHAMSYEDYTVITTGPVETTEKLERESSNATQQCKTILLSYQVPMPEDAEINCAETVTSIRIVDSSYKYVDHYGFFLISRPIYKYQYRKTIQGVLYCKPRTFSESAAMSLLKTCKDGGQGTDTQKCYSKDFLDRLDKVKPTKHKVVVDGRC
jgi:hypothetical protein